MLDIDSKPRSEYKKMLCWDNDEGEDKAVERVVIVDIRDKINPILCVMASSEKDFLSGESYYTSWYDNAKPIPEKPKFDYELLIGKSIKWYHEGSKGKSFCYGARSGYLNVVNEGNFGIIKVSYCDSLKYLDNGKWHEVNK